MDEGKFFDSIRKSLFSGRLTQGQVDGINAILVAFDQCEVRREDHRSYVLATAYHEVDRTMQPIEEYGRGSGKPYGKVDAATGHAYYGRGLVQLTWKANYQRMGDLLGIDLVRNPGLALQLPVAATILVEGMKRGSFTGAKLSDFLNDSKRDFVNARRIVNGLDRAEMIARYAEKFYSALVEAREEPDVPPMTLRERVDMLSERVQIIEDRLGNDDHG